MTISNHPLILKSMLFVFLGIIFTVLCILLLIFTPRDRAVFLSNNQTFEWAGQTRNYIVSRGDQTNSETKLIVGLHGFSDTLKRFAYYTGLHNAVGADDIVLYPSATPPTDKNQKSGWNAGFCCGSGWANQVDDVGFLSALAEHIAEQNGISPNNIFVAGFSNGAFMTQRLAAERPDVFKAAAARSGSIGTQKQTLTIKQPVPIYLSHGEQDQTVPFGGGVGKTDPDFTWKPFTDTVAAWQSANGTDTVTTVVTHPDDKHQWHDWRLFNFWHKLPEGSKDIISFFDSI